MSTRSLICIKRDKEHYEAIYCHSDGYLTFNGQMLFDNYKDREKVEKLISLGNISCLAENVEPDPTKPHSFDYSERQDGVVVAYGRDRGEEEQESVIQTLKELKKWGWIEYIYVFDEKNQWKVAEYPFDKFKSVETELDKYYKSIGIKHPEGFYGFWTDETIKREKKRQEQVEL